MALPCVVCSVKEDKQQLTLFDSTKGNNFCECESRPFIPCIQH